MHVAASIPNFVIMEEGNKETAEYKDVFTAGWKATLAQWEIPNGPGLGVEFHRYFSETRGQKLGRLSEPITSAADGGK